jgi:hypothetical protein
MDAALDLPGGIGHDGVAAVHKGAGASFVVAFKKAGGAKFVEKGQASQQVIHESLRAVWLVGVAAGAGPQAG